MAEGEYAIGEVRAGHAVVENPAHVGVLDLHEEKDHGITRVHVESSKDGDDARDVGLAGGAEAESKRRMIKALTFAVLVAASEISGPARIIDGDTIQIGQERIRFHGIDAPESKQTCQRDSIQYACGRDAAAALRAMIGAQAVTCTPKDVDRYHRIVAICYVAGRDLNRTMVEQGWAVAYRQYSTDYVDAEDQAKAGKRGLWAGEFISPWQYRRQ
jgi:endonuclease YncB( thermonuclease family)